MNVQKNFSIIKNVLINVQANIYSLTKKIVNV